MAGMMPRERAVAALNHEQPDRLPVDVAGSASTSTLVDGYGRPRAPLGIVGETRILTKAMRIAHLDEEVILYLGGDGRPIVVKPPIT